MIGYGTKLPNKLTRVDTRQAILSEFQSAENRSWLRDELSERFQTPSVDRYLAEYLGRAVDDFAREIAAELAESMPIRGTSTTDQVSTYNARFIGARSRFIHDHVAGSATTAYVVNDGLPTSRTTRAHYDRPANDILDGWRTAPGRGISAREDPQADTYGHSYGRHVAGYSVGTGSHYQSAPYMQTGIAFCDQSAIGTQNHVEQYENTSYKHALNTYGTHYDTPFGVSTPAADARLLNRRTFRSNEAGVENGIMRRDVRLHGRNLERDVAEGLRSGESGFIQRGFDMSGIDRRLAHKNAARARYGPKTYDLAARPDFSHM